MERNAQRTGVRSRMRPEDALGTTADGLRPPAVNEVQDMVRLIEFDTGRIT